MVRGIKPLMLNYVGFSCVVNQDSRPTQWHVTATRQRPEMNKGDKKKPR